MEKIARQYQPDALILYIPSYEERGVQVLVFLLFIRLKKWLLF